MQQSKSCWKVQVLLVLVSMLGYAGLTAQAVAAPNLVVNGSFEQTMNLSSPGGFICSGNNASCSSGATSNLTGWTSTCQSGGCGNGSSVGSVLFGGTGGSAFNNNAGFTSAAANSPDGGNFIGIDGDPQFTVTVQQTITGLTAGTAYTLTFFQAADEQNGNRNNTTSQWKVNFGSAAAQTSTLMSSMNGAFVPWATQSMTFIADSTSDVLKFMAVGTPAGVPPVALLDGVALSAAVPEPATWGLMLISLIGAFGIQRFFGRRTFGTVLPA